MNKIKEYKTVSECLAAGYTYEKCVGLKGIDKDGNFIMEIKKTCPLPMKKEIVEKLVEGKRTIYRDELPESKQPEPQKKNEAKKKKK